MKVTPNLGKWGMVELKPARCEERTARVVERRELVHVSRAEERRDVEGGKREVDVRDRRRLVLFSSFRFQILSHGYSYIHIPGATHERCHS